MVKEGLSSFKIMPKVALMIPAPIKATSVSATRGRIVLLMKNIEWQIYCLNFTQL
jgi:hypothetical protein